MEDDISTGVDETEYMYALQYQTGKVLATMMKEIAKINYRLDDKSEESLKESSRHFDDVSNQIKVLSSEIKTARCKERESVKTPYGKTPKGRNTEPRNTERLKHRKG